MGDAILLDQPQQLLSVETRVKNGKPTLPYGKEAIGVWRCVIERPRHHRPDLLARHKAEDLVRDQSNRLRELRPQIEAPHTLRTAGRAGGVDHARDRPGGAFRHWYEAGEPFVPEARAGGNLALL